MQDFQLRVIEEKEQLFEKIIKLEKFIENSSEKVEPSEYALLCEQLMYMLDYHYVLQQRVAKF